MDQRDDYREPYPPEPTKPWLLRRQRRYDFAIAALILVAGGLTFLRWVTKTMPGLSPTRVSINRASDVAEACESYRSNSPSHSHPASLDDLRKPLPGFGLLLADPEHDLCDHWGNPFRYAVVPDADGQPEVYVWFELTSDGKTTLHGAKRTAHGKLIRFGLPGDHAR
jgi:hypothetical protein